MRFVVLAGAACGHPAPPSPPPSNVAHAHADAAVEADLPHAFDISGVTSRGGKIVIIIGAGLDDGFRKTSTAQLVEPGGHAIETLVLVRMEETQSFWATTRPLVELSHDVVVVAR
jgi:hypothetical protein